ncbi:hypothetical protein OIDMADRAFT_20426 [Oidiodendron maius Zn]|uniref:Uncharacterized protein n=1 Tax=Oidiodendron maius (strain Zn) TaxID=913774 RepID=A0A0C3D8E2_OIDMZ|nr:hypothetical protein OIDMADRAFT_20426 [Oidiodendron maius Zn]
MPMNTTAGVVVECTDNALASSVLGLVATATTSTSFTGGIVTIPATTLVMTNPGVITTAATSSSSALTFVTITFTEPTIPETTTTDFVTVTKGEPRPTNSIAPAPSVPQVTAPPDPQTTSTFNGIAIIPVTDQNVSIEKETVTISVTVTKTIKVPEASIV